jgi:ParB family chromosome partitioning protein
MSSKSKRLGSLADVFKSEALDGTIRKIRLDRIRPSEKQPRQDRKKGIEELAQSLKSEGLLQPIVVARDEADEDTYKIIAGERRFHAATSLGWLEVECKIFDRNDKEIYKLAIIENLQREDLSPYEEVDALLHLKKEYKYTDQELAEMFGKSRSYMTEILSIANLPIQALRECRDLNLNNKNILVQAAQAEKKGNFKEFLERYKSGELRTVKDAKDFNRGGEILVPDPNIPGPDRSQSNRGKDPQKPGPQEGAFGNHSYKIQKKGDSILIVSESPEQLQEIYRWIRREIPKKFPGN